MPAKVFQFLVLREFERSVVFAAGLDVPQLVTNVFQMIRFRGLPAHARERQRSAPVSRSKLQACFELAPRLIDAAVELQLQAAEITKIRVIETIGLCAIH